MYSTLEKMLISFYTQPWVCYSSKRSSTEGEYICIALGDRLLVIGEEKR